MEIKNIIIILLVIIILYGILNEKITYAISRYLNYKIIQIPAKANVRNLLLISNSREYKLGAERYFNHCKSNIKKFLNPFNVKEVLFIPYAGAGTASPLGVPQNFDNYTTMVKKDFFDSVNIHINPIHKIKNIHDKQAAILNAQCIFIGGGNALKLMYKLEENELVESIRKAVARGVPFIGVSSGVVVANPTLQTSRSLPIFKVKSDKGLDLIPFYINVHYKITRNSKHDLGIRLNQFLLVEPQRKILAIPEGAMVHIVGNKGELVGFGGGELLERRAGRFLRKKLKSGANISFLL